MTFQLLTDVGSPNFFTPEKCLVYYGKPRIVTGITIHWWGDPAAGYTWDGTRRYLSSPGPRSAHEVIEEGKVSHIVEFAMCAFHAGPGNPSTIGLECNPRQSDGDYETIAERIADIRKQYGFYLPLFPHKQFMTTTCPGTYDLARLDKRALEIGAARNNSTPPPAPAFKQIAEDGVWGGDTTERLQQVFGTPVDRVVSHQWKSKANENIPAFQFDNTGIGSTLIRAIQARLGITGKSNDGLAGSVFVSALERHYGVTPDVPTPYISAGRSETVARMQHALNQNKF